ncbi:hypothetical protein BR93DRAFT_391150 [Coniochaeta sp. PMI_546]|nr:hypothetical protein BR93DRAFT_391150 [Coniochaeta sp. PMI_546]
MPRDPVMPLDALRTRCFCDSIAGNKEGKLHRERVMSLTAPLTEPTERLTLCWPQELAVFFQWCFVSRLRAEFMVASSLMISHSAARGMGNGHLFPAMRAKLQPGMVRDAFHLPLCACRVFLLLVCPLFGSGLLGCWPRRLRSKQGAPSFKGGKESCDACCVPSQQLSSLQRSMIAAAAELCWRGCACYKVTHRRCSEITGSTSLAGWLPLPAPPSTPPQPQQPSRKGSFAHSCCSSASQPSSFIGPALLHGGL